MPHYMSQFSYTPAAWPALTLNPVDGGAAQSRWGHLPGAIPDEPLIRSSDRSFLYFAADVVSRDLPHGFYSLRHLCETA